MPNQKLLIAAMALCLAPTPARAQFTAVITPPKKEEPAQVVEAAAKKDSLQTTRMTDLRAWVDSAAASLGAGTRPAPTVPDSVSAPAIPEATPDATPEAKPATPPVAHAGDMHSGARAPDTATPLPLLVVAGALLLALGLVIKTRERA